MDEAASTPYTIPPEAMPPALRELVRVLGDADAMRLIGLAGGTRLTVPTKVRDDHPLCVALGKDAFSRLVAHHHGETLELPKADAYLRELRHEQVRSYRAQGLKTDEIAGMTGYTRRHVINILGGHGTGGADTFTMDMFEEPAEPPISGSGQAHDPFGLGSRQR